MSNTIENLDIPSSTDTEGLNELFEAEVLPGNSVEPPGNTQEAPAGVTVQAASEKLGLSVKTIKDRLRKGTLKGFKKPGKYGKVWMVDPCEVGSTDSVPAGNPGDALLGNSSRGLLSSPSGTNNSLDRLLSQIEKKDRELQAAVYRNGYLESQLEIARTEVKLLPDLQTKAIQLEIRDKEIDSLKAEISTLKQSKWRKFINWFMGL